MNRQKNLLLVIVCAFWFGQYVHIPYQVTYLQSLGYSSGIVGLVVGAYGLVQVFFRMPFGLMADHAGKHKKIILFGVLCVGIASALRILIPNITGYFIANIFSGLGASAWISYMVLYLSYFDNDKLQSATGKILAVNNAGIFMGFLASSVTYAALGMKFICGLAVIIAVVAFVLGFRLKEHPSKVGTLTYGELLKTVRYKRLIYFSILALLQQGVQMATVMSFTVKVAKEIGASALEVGLTSIVYIVFTVLFAQLSTRPIFLRIGYRVIVPIGFLVQALYCILVPHMTNLYGIYVCQILAAVGMGFLFSALTSESMLGIPVNRSSTAMGIFQAIYAVGMTAFPILTGQIEEWCSLTVSYYVMAAVLFVGLISVLFFYYGSSKQYFAKKGTRYESRRKMEST